MLNLTSIQPHSKNQKPVQTIQVSLCFYRNTLIKGRVLSDTMQQHRHNTGRMATRGRMCFLPPEAHGVCPLGGRGLSRHSASSVLRRSGWRGDGGAAEPGCSHMCDPSVDRKRSMMVSTQHIISLGVREEG